LRDYVIIPSITLFKKDTGILETRTANNKTSRAICAQGAFRDCLEEKKAQNSITCILIICKGWVSIKLFSTKSMRVREKMFVKIKHI
jgi:hypothetical protein